MRRHKRRLSKRLRMNSSPNHTQPGRQLGPPDSLEKTGYLSCKLWRTRPEFSWRSLASCFASTLKRAWLSGSPQAVKECFIANALTNIESAKFLTSDNVKFPWIRDGITYS